VPAIVILFELYSHAPDFLHVEEHKRFFLYGYVIILAHPGFRGGEMAWKP
jgi:hypothetical protein